MTRPVCWPGNLCASLFGYHTADRLIQESTKAGLAAARARGRNGGRPKVTAKEARVVLAKKLHADKSLDIDDICRTLKISRSTLYRYVQL